MFIYTFFVNRDYCQCAKFLIANQQGLLPLCLSTNFLNRVCCRCVNCLIANQQGLLPLCLSTNFENRVYCQCVNFLIANQQGLPYCPCVYLQLSSTEFTVSVLTFLFISFLFFPQKTTYYCICLPHSNLLVHVYRIS